MKKIIVIAAVALAVMGMAGSALAVTTAPVSLTINATVSQNCTPIAPSTLTLAVDPTLLGEVDSTGGDTTVQCVINGSQYTVDAVSAGSGNSGVSGVLVGRLKAGGASDIPYTLYYRPSFAGQGIGSAVPIIFGVGSSIAQHGAVIGSGAASAATAGAPYTDQVTLTISY